MTHKLALEKNVYQSSLLFYKGQLTPKLIDRIVQVFCIFTDFLDYIFN